jgi:signal transduction histidine kinase
VLCAGRNPANSALLAADLLSEELQSDLEAAASGIETFACTPDGALEALQDKMELVATIKDALQQQIHVFTDALDWEKILSGSFTLERQPVAIVQEMQALVHMMVRSLCWSCRCPLFLQDAPWASAKC